MFVVHCAEHPCVGWFWRLKIGLMRQVPLPVHRRPFLCFELQCSCNELNIKQKYFLGLPFTSWVYLLMTQNEALAAHTCPIYPHLASLLRFV
jgi:hypothetical protein